MQILKPKPGYKLVKSLFGKEIEIPEDWNFQQLGKLTKVTDGSHYSPEKVSNGFPLATVENVKGDSIDIDSCYQISKDDYEQLVKNGDQPEIGDVLFTKDGTVGKTLVYNQKTKMVILSSIAIIHKSKKIDSDYCNYALQSKFMIKHLAKYFGGTAIKRIILRHLSKYEFPIPPYSEQQKISSILSTVDNLISSYNSIIETTKRLKTGLMQKLLIKGIDHKKFKKVKWLFGKEIEIPEVWQIQKLKDSCEKIIDGPHQSPEYTETGIPFITVNNILGGKIDLTNAKFISKKDHEIYSKRANPEKGDILYTKGGTTGFAKEIDVDFEFSIWVHIALLKLKKDIAKSKYLEFFLNSEIGRKQAKMHTYGVGNQDLVLGRMGKILVILPPIEEQHRIGHILFYINSKIHDLETKMTSLENLKKGLMQKLLTGQIRV